MTQDLNDIWRLTERHGTFSLPVLETGLFPAANVAGGDREYTNYHLVWVRDNVHVAHQLAVVGEKRAAKTVEALTSFFTKYGSRFVDTLEGGTDTVRDLDRPHVRLDGENLSELRDASPDWNHRQNDALGYFVWLFAKLAFSERFIPTDDQLKTVCLFPQFFARIEYWQDEDSGHWEEWPKVEASSIGVVVAGLRMLRALGDVPSLGPRLLRYGVGSELLDGLIQKGEQALADILPNECIQESDFRDVDAALLFLIYPLELLDDGVADEILFNVVSQLQGEIGIARYARDSFWRPDYKRDFNEDERTAPVKSNDKRRHAEVERGQEAQWCIFDSIISCIYGKRYLVTNMQKNLEQQIHYLNRSLRQLTPKDHHLGAYRCPEAYYLENGKWVPNDSTPLLWAQANLRLALHFADSSARRLAVDDV